MHCLAIRVQRCGTHLRQRTAQFRWAGLLCELARDYLQRSGEEVDRLFKRTGYVPVRYRTEQTPACELRLAGPEMRYEIDWLPLLPMTQEILIQACVHCVNIGDEYVGLSGLGNSKT